MILITSIDVVKDYHHHNWPSFILLLLGVIGWLLVWASILRELLKGKAVSGPDSGEGSKPK
jgi:hypothetical protein